MHDPSRAHVPSKIKRPLTRARSPPPRTIVAAITVDPSGSACASSTKSSVPAPSPATVPVNVSRIGAPTILPSGWITKVAEATVVPARSPVQVEYDTPDNFRFAPAWLISVGVWGVTDQAP